MQVQYYFKKDNQLFTTPAYNSISQKNITLTQIEVKLNKTTYVFPQNKRVTQKLIKSLTKLENTLKEYNTIQTINDNLEKPIVKVYKNTEDILASMFSIKELITHVKNDSYKDNLPYFIIYDDRLISLSEHEVEIHYNDNAEKILKEFITQTFNTHDLIFILNDKRKLLGTYQTIDDAWMKFEEHRNKNSTLKSYYQKMHITKDNVLHIDYGAHNAFYEITNADELNINGSEEHV